MKIVTPAIIDLTEFVYDLDVPREDWVPSLLEAGLPLFDHGHGVVATTYMRPPESGVPVPTKFYQVSGPSDLAERLFVAAYEADDETLRDVNRSGVVTTLSEEAHRFPAGHETFKRHLAPAKDLLAITAVDPNGVGLSLAIMLPEVTRLTGRDREAWKMVGAHLVSGFRLRQSLEEARAATLKDTRLPNNAEAVLDPKKLTITDAAGQAKDPSTGEYIREAAHPNPPDLKDPRGLSERERQVTTYVCLGETNKLISYRLGIAQSKVSTTLKSAMHKLGVQTRPQLVEKLRAFESVV